MKLKLLYNQSASKTHGLIWVLQGENNLLSEKKIHIDKRIQSTLYGEMIPERAACLRRKNSQLDGP